MKQQIIIFTLGLFLVLSCKSRKEKNLNSTSDSIIPVDTSLVMVDEPRNNIIDSTIKVDGDMVFWSCEIMPEFPGGEKALIEYINNNTRYPQSAVNDSTEGRVILKFVIKANGETREIQILRSRS